MGRSAFSSIVAKVTLCVGHDAGHRRYDNNRGREVAVRLAACLEEGEESYCCELLESVGSVVFNFFLLSELIVEGH